MIDLTGMQFGKWTVMYKTNKTSCGTAYWHCRCDCGTEKDVLGSNLRQGKTTSCGCERARINSEVHRKDITGQRFGKLTALYPTDKRAWSFIVWHCKCDCGNEKDVSIGHLMSGDVSSCGQCGYAKQLAIENNTKWASESEKKDCKGVQ